MQTYKKGISRKKWIEVLFGIYSPNCFLAMYSNCLKMFSIFTARSVRNTLKIEVKFPGKNTSGILNGRRNNLGGI